jgi:hypothetical protein
MRVGVAKLLRRFVVLEPEAFEVNVFARSVKYL